MSRNPKNDVLDPFAWVEKSEKHRKLPKNAEISLKKVNIGFLA